MWPSSRPASHATLLLHLYPDFLMMCLKRTLQLAESGLIITQKSPLRLAYSLCRAPSVWSERWSWVGRESGLFIVQISSWWSVIWTVCLASILCSSGPVIGQQFRHCFALLWNTYNFDPELTQNPLQQATEENTRKKMGVLLWALWFRSFGSIPTWQ